ncbi:uncharacterized protein LOC144371758 isoform X1 [Ictidomys tridecemlineatus]
MNVFLCEAAKEDTGKARVESVQMGATHMADARLCLAFPSLWGSTPHEALVNDPQFLPPVLSHLKAVHVGTTWWPHGKIHIQASAPRAATGPGPGRGPWPRLRRGTEPGLGPGPGSAARSTTATRRGIGGPRRVGGKGGGRNLVAAAATAAPRWILILQLRLRLPLRLLLRLPYRLGFRLGLQLELSPAARTLGRLHLPGRLHLVGGVHLPGRLHLPRRLHLPLHLRLRLHLPLRLLRRLCRLRLLYLLRLHWRRLLPLLAGLWRPLGVAARGPRRPGVSPARPERAWWLWQLDPKGTFTEGGGGGSRRRPRESSRRSPLAEAASAARPRFL